MEINITIDIQSFKRAGLSLAKNRLFQGVAMATLLGSATYAYAIDSSPSHVFVAGQPISSANVNQNFSELYSAVNTLETSTATLTSELDTKSALSDCNWHYGFRATVSGTLECPANTHAISGSCSVIGSNQVRASRPSRNNPGADQPLSASTGWLCTQSAAGAMDMQALCCPL